MADKKVSIKLSEKTKIILDMPLYQEAPKSWLDDIKVSGCTGYSLRGGLIAPAESRINNL